MPAPEVKLTIKDGALGLPPPDASAVQAKIGVSSLGAENTVYTFTSKDDLVATLGTGPLVEAAGIALGGGGPVHVVKATASVPAVTSAVVATRVGTSLGTVTVAGLALDSYDVKVEVTKAGEPGAAEFKFTLDGVSYSAVLQVPSGGSYPVANSGLTLTFAQGASSPSFDAGDVFSFATTAATMSATDLVAALDALTTDVRQWSFVHVVGTVSAATAVLVGQKLDDAASQHRFARALVEARDQSAAESAQAWVTALLADWASFAHTRVAVAAGAADIVSSITGRTSRRSSAWLVARRASEVPMSRDLGRVADGPLSGVVGVYHDARVNPSLHDARFVTLRTFLGEPGVYITKSLLFAPPGSDFGLWQYGRVIDEACKTARRSLIAFLNDSVRVNDASSDASPGMPGAPGTIDEGDARAIDREVTSALEAALLAPGHTSDVSFRTNRTDNMLSTQKLRGDIAVTPLGYFGSVEVTVGYENPALSL